MSQEGQGAKLLDEGRFAEALPALREEHQRAPRRGSGHRLGYCHLMLGDFAAAERVLIDEVRAWPDLVDAYNALGVAQVNQSRHEEALAAFRQAERLRPGSAEAANNIGNILSDLGRYDEAIPYLQKAIAAQPGLPDAHHNLGLVYQSLKRHGEAVGALRKALSLAPESSHTLSHLLWSELATCSWDGLGEEIERLRAQVRGGIAAAPLVFLAVSPSPEEQRRCAELHLRDKLPVRPAPLWQGARYAHGRIRLAYLSSDFQEHATAQLAAGLFERHDRTRFEVIGFSYGEDDGGPMRRRLAAAFDRFVDVRAQGDAQAAALLREMEVDIAIDMKGHTTDARPGILAHRPAPVQAGFLGFPGTSGADFIDYLFADRRVLPEAEQRFYSEKVVYLPDCYQVNDSTRRVAPPPATRAAAGLPAEGFVFCSFNNNYKIAPPVFEVWMRLLAQLPGSVLWLLEDNRDASRNLRREAQGRGIDPGRLVFAPRAPHAEHLARQGLADLFLDTLPINAHTSASDALWAGLPLLTCSGTAFPGRVAASLLHAVGLPELVTHSLQDYEALALRLARESWLLAELKAKLARNRSREALFDTDRFRRNIELAYAAMWEAAQRGEPPKPFAVDPGSSR